MARFLRFSELFKFLVPSWLSGDEPEQGADPDAVDDAWKVQESLTSLLDASLERAKQGHLAQYPTSAPSDGLTKIGRDRAIPRGRSETAEHYAARLVQWRYPQGHRTRGSAWALLRQVYEYFGGIAASTIDVRGNEYSIDADGNETVLQGQAWDWDGAPASPRWSRFWLRIDDGAGVISAAPDWGDPELWGGSFPAPDYAIGLVGFGPDDRRAMVDLLYGAHPWRPAGTLPETMVFSLDGSLIAPDGSWGNWSENVGGTQVPSRDRSLRYIALAPGALDYTPDPTNNPSAFTLVDGTVYTPDPTNNPTTIPLPDGTDYTPDPTHNPTTIPLVDDGMPAT